MTAEAEARGGLNVHPTIHRARRALEILDEAGAVDGLPEIVGALMNELEGARKSSAKYEGAWNRADARVLELSTRIAALEAELAGIDEDLEVMIEAIKFYADPGTYHACSFFWDPPTGGWSEDFDYDSSYDRDMPGKTARSAIDKVNARRKAES